MDNVAAARYALELNPELKSVSGINQNYAWGQDSWNDFINSMKQLNPGVEVNTEQFPKLFAGQYGSEVSALMVNPSDVIHSSFWGGDMEGFVLQASARGLFEDQTPLLTTGESAMFRFSEQMPTGAALGVRGPFGVFAPESALNDWFRKNYIERFDTPPTYPSYKIAQAILGLKTAYEKAQAATGGGEPTTEEIIAAFEGLEFTGPGGVVNMALGNGHQAMMEMVYGQYELKDGKPSVTNLKRYAAKCVNPPDGISSQEWIAGGFEGRPMLEISELDAHIERTPILRHVNFSLPTDSIVGLIGRNGAGKTTLMRSIMGLIQPTSGTIVIDGVDVTARPGHERCGFRVGYMPEDRRLVPDLTVEENILVPGWSAKFADLRERLSWVYELMPEVERFADRKALQLSGGQQKLVALARALLIGQKLLLLDEPFEGIAPALSQRLVEVLGRLRNEGQGLSVLLSESDYTHSAGVVDHVYTIERGEVSEGAIA